MRKMDSLIIGYGIVGKNMEKFILKNDKLRNVFIRDPKLGFHEPKGVCFDIGFVCVPTDETIGDGTCDTSIVEKVVREYSDKCRVLCIKSTVPPGSTKRFAEKYNTNLVFSPEFFGASVHANTIGFDYVILGGNNEDVKYVAEFYKQITNPSFKIIKTDSKTAELCKYMDNCWLGTKVTFINEFARVAESIGVDYNELRELWLMDPRINRSHTYSYKEQPYYDSHCLNKDIPAFIKFCIDNDLNSDLMNAVSLTNDKRKYT